MFKIYLLLVLVFLSFFLLKAIRDFIAASQTNNWQETEGVILSAKLLHVSKTMTQGKNKEQYTFAINYEYSALGQKYQGNRVKFFPFDTSTSKRQIEKQLAKYSEGMRQPVYFDPKNPNESILEKGLSPNAFIASAIILFLIGMVSWILLMEFR